MLQRIVFLLFALWTGLPTAGHGASPPGNATPLVEAVLAEDPIRQAELIKGLGVTGDDWTQQALIAWRGGSVFLIETNGLKIPVLLDPQTDAQGHSMAMALQDGKPLRDLNGQALFYNAADLNPADANARLRKIIKTTLDILALANPNSKMRRDAAVKLGQAQNHDYLPYFEARLKVENNPDVSKSLREALALTQVTSPEKSTRVAAIRRLGDLRSINSLSALQELQLETKKSPGKFDPEIREALRQAVVEIETYVWWGNLFGTLFRGLSLSSVLLVSALGLAITFGLMGVINMAHGELMMIGAYAAYVTQNIFKNQFGAESWQFDAYFLVALVVAFISAAAVGLALERGVIRFLYKRPLESLLATWGVSLVLQQLFRATFGAANVQVDSPRWLSGSFVVSDVLLAYNRLFVIALAIGIVLLTYTLLTRTSLGLQIRAVMQHRSMAASLGVRTDRVNMLTFAFGSGLAGVAGACLSQIGNVGPSLGQNYIVDCFMIVVLGGVGNLGGTVSASFGVGMTDQMLQPWVGAVMGKIMVLAGIILFLQWRPAGLFAHRSRSLEG